MPIHYVTQEGLDKLKKELADALAQRPVISAAIAEAREKGDLSENAEYESARESQIGTDKVQMLNKVTVKNISLNKVMTFTLVGESEADFSAGKLSATTPIGKALMGHSKGDVVEAKVPSGIIKFEILDITL